MKILHVCTGYFPFYGGVEIHVQRIAENLASRGHDLYVYTTDPTGKLPVRETLNGVEVNRFLAFAPNDAYYFSYGLFKALKRLEVDIVHAHGLQAFPMLFAALRRKSNKFVASLHSGGTSSRFRQFLFLPYTRFILNYALRQADVIVCVSKYEMDTYPRALHLPRAKFVYIPNGSDLINENECSGAETFSSGKSRMILTVGRLEKWKGFHTLIKSFAIMKKESRNNDLKFVIVGKGPCEQELLELAAKNGVTNDMLLLKDVPRQELERLYRQCDAFLQLSDHGYPGIAVYDAIAAGKPAIVTNIGITRELVERAYCYGVDSPPDPVEVAATVNAILANPRAFRPRKMKMLSWSEVARNVIELYEEIATN